MKQICQTTLDLARELSKHPAVRKAHHPLLPGHPSQSIASRLYPHGTGGILALELAGEGFSVVNRFVQAASGMPFSPTLADARTTISHPATTSHRFMTAEQRAEIGIRDELIRVSVGLEPLEQLKVEFSQVLEVITG